MEEPTETVICCFCFKRAVHAEALAIEVSESGKGRGGFVQGFLAHRECLKRALHPAIPVHSKLDADS
jgi:hypothetical protein